MDPIINPEQIHQARIKRELIEAIGRLNRSARSNFLNRFSIAQLQAYLNHLSEVEDEICRTYALAG